MFAFTITTKDKCRHSIVEFEAEMFKYLVSKGVDLVGLFYKLEESKYTKWHAHGDYHKKWETSKDDKFYVHFKEITDIYSWHGYCTKSELDNGTPSLYRRLRARMARPLLGKFPLWPMALSTLSPLLN